MFAAGTLDKRLDDPFLALNLLFQRFARVDQNNISPVGG